MKTTLTYFTEDVQNLLGLSTKAKTIRKLDHQLASELYTLPAMIADRAWCELDSRLLQPICYIALKRNKDSTEQYLTYIRGKASGETRLIEKRSIGWGGHIEELPTHSVRELLTTSAVRELAEELGPDISKDSVLSQIKEQLSSPVVYWDPLDAVNMVHLAFFIVVNIDFDFTINEETGIIKDTKWINKNDLININLEPWSVALLENT